MENLFFFLSYLFYDCHYYYWCCYFYSCYYHWCCWYYFDDSPYCSCYSYYYSHCRRSSSLSLDDCRCYHRYQNQNRYHLNRLMTQRSLVRQSMYIITKAKLISRESLNFFLHLDWKLLTSSIAIWWDCCCCCCVCCCRCWVDIALDAFGISIDDDDDVAELLLLLLFLLYITDDCGWLLAKLSSSKLGILGNVDVLLLAFHLLKI